MLFSACFSRHAKSFFLLALSLIILTTMMAWPSPVRAEAGSGNLMFILDASGSMWGQIGGQAKIAIAKQVLTDLITGLPDDMRVGLTAYGHRRKGDCDDVQVLAPLGRLDKQKLIGLIKHISPKGKTPMVRSIKLAADKLKQLEDRTTIILISDGLETCDPDPCWFVKTLRQSGIKFVMHVVGFGVSGKADQELGCMARAGGGKYYPASDADKLKKSLTEAVAEVGAVSLIVSGFGPQGEPMPVWARAYDASGREVDANTGKQAKLTLPPGTYKVTVKSGLTSIKQTVELKDVKVVKGRVTKRKVIFAKARIKVSVKDSAGKSAKGYARIVRLSDGQYADEGSVGTESRVFQVSPGRYVVDCECPGTHMRVKSQPFDLAPGQEKSITATCAGARVKVSLKDHTGKPIKGYARIVVPADGQYADEGSVGTEPRVFKVVPGRYLVDCECPGTHKRVRSQAFDLAPGQEKSITATCAEARIKVSVKNPAGKPSKGYARIVIPADGQYADEGSVGTESRVFRVVPGRYVVDCECPKTGQRIKSQPFEVKAGDEVTKEVICR